MYQVALYPTLRNQVTNKLVILDIFYNTIQDAALSTISDKEPVQFDGISYQVHIINVSHERVFRIK